MATATIEQRIAQKEAELARLRRQGRALENGQKIILGGLLLNSARHDPKILSWLLEAVSKGVMREVDRKRLYPLLAELKALELGGDDPKPPPLQEQKKPDK